MASILDRYGIKEVMDVTFYEIDGAGNPGKPVLYLDTLKVSTIEQSAEQSDARGGKGNPKLITWDYGKEINVTIEDALFSAKSLSVMFADGKVDAAAEEYVDKITTMRLDGSGKLDKYFWADIYSSNAAGGTAERKKVWVSNDACPADAIPLSSVSGLGISGTLYSMILFHEDGTVIKGGAVDSEGKVTISGLSAADFVATYASNANQKAFLTYKSKAKARTFNVSGDSFPGTYYMSGATYARSDVNGQDSFVQFIIPKCKMQASNTITLQADGDPSVFNMSLTVLRPDDGVMMKIKQFDLIA